MVNRGLEPRNFAPRLTWLFRGATFPLFRAATGLIVSRRDCSNCFAVRKPPYLSFAVELRYP
jgi:hypothetical protein